MTIGEIAKNITELDKKSMEAARKRQENLLKPLGSLGVLETISIQLAGITGQVKNKIDKKIHFLFGADNGVYEEGVAAAPQSLTRTLMELYGQDKNCAINVICTHNHVELKLVDVGVIGTIDSPNIINRKLMDGTNNFCRECAIPPEIVEKAVQVGFEMAGYANDHGFDVIGNGEVGMGNTSTAAACIMAALGLSDAEMAVGRGAGLTDEAFEHKKKIISEALTKHKPDAKDSFDILSKVGGLDIAAMVGLYLGAAYYKKPIIIDGVISVAAALLASRIAPLAKQYMIPSHISEEPAYKLAVEEMKLSPMLCLGMRLGEGSGCPIAMGVMENAVAIMNDMLTYDDLK